VNFIPGIFCTQFDAFPASEYNEIEIEIEINNNISTTLRTRTEMVFETLVSTEPPHPADNPRKLHYRSILYFRV
jgi:hypothetical protein